MIKRQTLASKVRVEGRGIHTGERGTVTIWPGNSGFQIIGPNGPVPLTPSLVASVERSTALEVCGTLVFTVEHLLSALNGLGVTDCVLEFTGPEAPILDGSSKPYATAILKGGLRTLGFRPKREFEEFGLISGDTKMRVRPGTGAVYVLVEYEHPSIGVQELRVELTPERYLEEFAPARTFGFEAEAEKLRASGLAKGASRSNTLVFSETGPMAPLRFPDEPVRHKALDIIGDLALSGLSIYELSVHAERPGHATNVTCARRLYEAAGRWEG